MTYLPLAIAAYFLNSIAVTVDKFLLTKIIAEPLIYIFYFSLISTFALLAIPFIDVPSTQVLIFASSSTIFWTLGGYLMFLALKMGQVQRVIPVIGALSSLFLLALTSGFGVISTMESWAIIFLISGLICLTWEDMRGGASLKELFWEASSAFFFALAYLFLKFSFQLEDFFTVVVWSRPVLIPLAVIFFIIPALRKKVLNFSNGGINSLKRATPLFVFGQISAGISEFLVYFAISLANPAVVNSLQGVKYVFLLIFSFILGKRYPTIFKRPESLSSAIFAILGILLIFIGLAILARS